MGILSKIGTVVHVIGETPCTAEKVEIKVGICDDFNINLVTEVTSPSQALLDWITAHYYTSDARDCDEDVQNRYWAHAPIWLVPSPCCHVVSATLEIIIKNKHFNVTLKIGCITDSKDSWEVSKELLTCFSIDVGSIGTIFWI